MHAVCVLVRLLTCALFMSAQQTVLSTTPHRLSRPPGRNVLLVDDSIVRGTTSAQLVQLAREAGAKNIFFCSAAPAIRFPNVYGTSRGP